MANKKLLAVLAAELQKREYKEAVDKYSILVDKYDKLADKVIELRKEVQKARVTPAKIAKIVGIKGSRNFNLPILRTAVTVVGTYIEVELP